MLAWVKVRELRLRLKAEAPYSLKMRLDKRTTTLLIVIIAAVVFLQSPGALGLPLWAGLVVIPPVAVLMTLAINRFVR